MGGRNIIIGARPHHRQGDDIRLRNINIQNAYEQEDHLPENPDYDRLIEKKKIIVRYRKPIGVKSRLFCRNINFF